MPAYTLVNGNPIRAGGLSTRGAALPMHVPTAPRSTLRPTYARSTLCLGPRSSQRADEYSKGVIESFRSASPRYAEQGVTAVISFARGYYRRSVGYTKSRHSQVVRARNPLSTDTHCWRDRLSLVPVPKPRPGVSASGSPLVTTMAHYHVTHTAKRSRQTIMACRRVASCESQVAIGSPSLPQGTNAVSRETRPRYAG